MEMSEQALAEACTDNLWRNDRCTKALGITLEKISPGSAVLSMKVTEDMLNGHHTCHGGMMFTLADSAFAFACNGTSVVNVAQHCSVSFLKPVYQDEIIVATALERWREGRSGIFDVTLTNEAGESVAEFRGHSRSVSGNNLPEENSHA